METNNKSGKHRRIVTSANGPEINEEAPGEGWGTDLHRESRKGGSYTEGEHTGPEEDSHAKNRETVHEANKVLEVGK